VTDVLTKGAEGLESASGKLLSKIRLLAVSAWLLPQYIQGLSYLQGRKDSKRSSKRLYRLQISILYPRPWCLCCQECTSSIQQHRPFICNCWRHFSGTPQYWTRL